uniref:CUT domain-containing protein n=2 Tax=Caenorhabditis tropicalis TaxID=1561998 RepID=A0A1I7THS3_9PELO
MWFLDIFKIAAVSDSPLPMVFGFSSASSNGSSTSTSSSREKMEKPTSLPLQYDQDQGGADCLTPRRAEFSIDDDEPLPTSSEDPTIPSSGDEGVLQQSLIQLQKQLRKTDVRCSRLEKICEFQQVSQWLYKFSPSSLITHRNGQNDPYIKWIG